MRDFDYYSDLDSHPFTGERKVDFKAKISEKEFLNGYFDGTPNYDQVKDVTRGKVYDIYKVEGFGDMASFYFINDAGKEDCLCDFFFEKRSKQESEELNMAAQAERLKISITEENRAIRALQEAAYIKGYMTAELRERERRKKARERRKRKRYFLTQKLYGVAMLILTAVSVKLLEGDITVAFVLVPMGIVLITSKEMLIVNEYFWESEGM